MSSQITPTPIIQYTPLRPYTRHLLIDFQYFRLFHSLLQPHHVTVSYHFRGDNPPYLGRTVWKNAGQSKNGCVNLNHQHMLKGSSLLVTKPPPSPLCCSNPHSRHASIHPTNQPSYVGLPRARPSFTYFRHQPPSSHTVLVHSLHKPKPSRYSDQPFADSFSIPAL